MEKKKPEDQAKPEDKTKPETKKDLTPLVRELFEFINSGKSGLRPMTEQQKRDFPMAGFSASFVPPKKKAKPTSKG